MQWRAGIMALPRAVATMGAIPGALLILFAYVVSFVTMDVLSRCVSGPSKRLTTTVHCMAPPCSSSLPLSRLPGAIIGTASVKMHNMATVLSKLQGQRVQWALDLWRAHTLLLRNTWLVGVATLHLHQQPRSAIPSRANTCTSDTAARDTPKTLSSLFRLRHPFLCRAVDNIHHHAGGCACGQGSGVQWLHH